MAKSAVVITISPLRLIQDNNVAEFNKYGIPSIAIDSFTPEDPALWKTIREHNMYQHYSVSSEQCGPYQGHIPRFAKLLHDPKWVKRIKLLQMKRISSRPRSAREGSSVPISILGPRRGLACSSPFSHILYSSRSVMTVLHTARISAAKTRNIFWMFNEWPKENMWFKLASTCDTPRIGYQHGYKLVPGISNDPG
ncbi:hypothetical protein B0H14DRAFT_2646643 [Mycena olivaceomarginata]|nr:hypothetical protein B0H14DRAFT_2646643 [Mycena olivaceomarginata]